MKKLKSNIQLVGSLMMAWGVTIPLLKFKVIFLKVKVAFLKDFYNK
jgi:hypothetical protein